MNAPAVPTRRFLYKSAIYAIGDLLTKGSRFILIPFYAHTFSQNDMGLMALLMAIAVASQIGLSLGLNFGVRRFHVDEEETRDRANRFVSTMFWARALYSLPWVAVLMLTGWLYCRFSDTQLSVPLVFGAIGIGYFRSGLNIYENSLIVREEPVQYRAFTCSQFVSTTALVVLAVVVGEFGLHGAIFAELFALVVWFVGVATFVTRRAVPRLGSLDWTKIRNHCVPAIPHLMFMWALASADRLLLERFGISTEEIAVYEVGYLVATALSVFSIAMQAAWFPGFFRTATNAGSKHEYGKTATLYFAVVTVVGVALALVAPECIAIVAPDAYSGAADIMRVVLIGNFFLTVFTACSQPLLFENRTLQMSLASGIGLTANIVANVILIPRMGLMGAAIATVVAYATIAATAFIMAQRVFPVQWDYESAALLGVGAIAAAAIGIRSADPGAQSLVLRVGLGVAFTAFALAIVWRKRKSAQLVGTNTREAAQ